MREKDEFHAVRIHLQFEIANKSHFKLFQSLRYWTLWRDDRHLIILWLFFYELVKLEHFSAGKAAASGLI